MRKYIIVALILVVIILATGAGYLIFQNQKLTRQFSKLASPSPTLSHPQSTSPSPVSLPTPSPKLTAKEVQENIEAAVNSGNTAAIGTFTANPVSVILQATECCGPKTPDEAVTQLAYVSEGAPFNFNQNLDLIKSLKIKNLELDGKFIGISQNKEHLVAFGLNADNRITDIRMSVSYKLFSY